MPRPANPPDESTFMGQIGARIRRQRAKQKLSVEEAAAAAGASAQAWYHWEQGKHLALDRLPAIAEAVGCSVRALIPPDA